MYCNRLNFRSTWICASAFAAKMRRHAIDRIRPITVLNDEIRMPNDEARNNVSILVQLFVIPVSTFDIRASSFWRTHLRVATADLVWFCARSTDQTLSHCAELFSAAGKSCKS